MWRANGSRRPRIPEGDPDPILYKPLWDKAKVNLVKRNAEKEMLRASKSIEKKGFIINGIAKYIQYWRSSMARNARYAVEMSSFMEYWKQIHREISGPLPIQSDSLLEGFWPISDWKRDHPWSSSTEYGPMYVPDNTPENDPKPYPFCSPIKDRQRPNFNPYRDVLLRDSVLCCPSHNNHFLVWQGRALTYMDKTPDDNYGQFTVEWWMLMKGKREGKHVFTREC